ncbi:MAG: TolC family protein [Nitrospiraceae bacterium]
MKSFHRPPRLRSFRSRQGQSLWHRPHPAADCDRHGLHFFPILLNAAEGPAPSSVLPSAVRLSLGEALAFFLKQNLDLLIAKYGIESNKGQQITARLLPNPTLQVGNVGFVTQGNNPATTGAITSQVQQLFETAGKRGSAWKAPPTVQSSEADFEDAVRQLSFAVKDAYFRVQLAQRRWPWRKRIVTGSRASWM